MKKARFTESQIVVILKEADAGLPVREVIRKHGISSASYYKWKAKYGGLDASEIKRIKGLEGQLAEFKRESWPILALENKAMKGLITNSFFRQPESVKRWIIWRADEKLPVTRACGCVGLSRAAYYRKPMDQAKRDAPVVDVLNQIVAKHGRWGFGLCFSWMRNKGYLWNHKRVWRVYKDMRLSLPRRTKRRLPKLPRQPLIVPRPRRTSPVPWTSCMTLFITAGPLEP
jgi:putative transposase